MTIDEMRDKLDDIETEISAIADELEGIDKSDLSATNKHYCEQAVKLMRSAAGYVEEADLYLELPD